MKTMNKIKHPFSCYKIREYISLFISFLLLIFTSCKEDSLAEETQKSSLKMQMRTVSSSLVDNTSIYVFDTNNKFIEKKLNVIHLDGVLTTSMKVGSWNLALLASNIDISNNIILPSYQGLMSSSPMWKTKETSDGQFLSQTPAELRYASMPNTEIVKDITTYKNTTLNRNVAKIQVILKAHSGFDPVSAGTNQYSFVELLDVPTTLSWDGKLYPNKTNPEMSDKPIREYFKFDGNEKADTITFIVPAHRGLDAFELQHNDTTTHKLKLRASMPLKGKAYYGKGAVTIPYVPKINSITQVSITLRAEPNTLLDIKITVKDWEKEIVQSEEFN